MQLESNPNVESSSRALAPLGLVEDHALVGHQRLIQLRSVPESLCIASTPLCQAPYLWHFVYPQWLSEHDGLALPISILGLLPDNLGSSTTSPAFETSNRWLIYIWNAW